MATLKVRWQARVPGVTALAIDGGVVRAWRDERVVTLDLLDGSVLAEDDLDPRYDQAEAVAWQGWVLRVHELDLVVVDADGTVVGTLHGGPPEYDVVRPAVTTDVAVVALPEGTLTCLATSGAGVGLDRLAALPSGVARNFAEIVTDPADPLRSAPGIGRHRDQEVYERIARWLTVELVPEVLGVDVVAPTVGALLPLWERGPGFGGDDAWALWWWLTAPLRPDRWRVIGEQAAGELMAGDPDPDRLGDDLAALSMQPLAFNLCSSLPRNLGFDAADGLALGLPWSHVQLVATALAQGKAAGPDPIGGILDHLRLTVPDDVARIEVFAADEVDPERLAWLNTALAEGLPEELGTFVPVLPAAVLGHVAAGLVVRHAARTGRLVDARDAARRTGRAVLAELVDE